MRALTLVLLIILMKGTEHFVIDKREQHNGEQKLLLRKLLSSQQNNSTEKSFTWNEILANVFVNRIKTIFTKQPENGIGDEPDIVTKCVSEIIGLYKKFYWDRNKNYISEERLDPNQTPIDESGDPKQDVETVEPKYRGRIENVTDSNIEKRSVCPDDSVSDGKGNCVDPKNLKFIMAIPYQCPFGYRRDRLGYCRPLF